MKKLFLISMLGCCIAPVFSHVNPTLNNIVLTHFTAVEVQNCSVTIHVVADNLPLSGAAISIIKGKRVLATANTNSSGVAMLTVESYDNSPIKIQISKEGYQTKLFVKKTLQNGKTYDFKLAKGVGTAIIEPETIPFGQSTTALPSTNTKAEALAVQTMITESLGKENTNVLAEKNQLDSAKVMVLKANQTLIEATAKNDTAQTIYKQTKEMVSVKKAAAKQAKSEMKAAKKQLKTVEKQQKNAEKTLKAAEKDLSSAEKAQKNINKIISKIDKNNEKLKDLNAKMKNVETSLSQSTTAEEKAKWQSKLDKLIDKQNKFKEKDKALLEEVKELKGELK